MENTAPVLTEEEAAILTDEDMPGTCALHATDPDGDALLWSATEPALGVVTVLLAVTMIPTLAAARSNDSWTRQT